MKKSILIFLLTITFISVFCTGCRNNPTEKAHTNYFEKKKEEKLKVCTKKQFYHESEKHKREDSWKILQIIQSKIVMTNGKYLIRLEKQKGKYQIKDMIDLSLYGVDGCFNEYGTLFYPSENGDQYLIFNSWDQKKNGEGIKYFENKNLKSIVINFKTRKIDYFQGNDFTKLQAKEKISKKWLAKEIETPKAVMDYQEKTYGFHSVVSYEVDKKSSVAVLKEGEQEEINPLKWGIYNYQYSNKKISRVFKF